MLFIHSLVYLFIPFHTSFIYVKGYWDSIFKRVRNASQSTASLNSLAGSTTRRDQSSFEMWSPHLVHERTREPVDVVSRTCISNLWWNIPDRSGNQRGRDLSIYKRSVSTFRASRISLLRTLSLNVTL